MSAELTKTKPNVLVVEDENQLLEYVSVVLNRYGYSVLTAEQGEEAWALFEENQNSIKLVLTDIVMPGFFDGFELCERIHQLAPDIPVIFMTGAIPEDDPRAEKLVRENRLLRKPFFPNQLLEIIKHHLSAEVSAKSTA
jgi:two-component system, cell cycle sensor histidine kinase and response regulator CckA